MIKAARSDFFFTNCITLKNDGVVYSCCVSIIISITDSTFPGQLCHISKENDN